LASDPALLRVVRAKLELDWSPGQIPNWLKHRHRDPALQISHETIYRSVYLATRTELGPRPVRYLRSQRSVRQVRKTKQAHGRGILRNMTSIEERPVEHATRYVRVVPLPGTGPMRSDVRSPRISSTCLPPYVRP